MNKNPARTVLVEHYYAGLKRLLAKGEINEEKYQSKISVGSITTIEP